MEEKILFETIKKNLKSALIVYKKDNSTIFINDRAEEILESIDMNSYEFLKEIHKHESSEKENRKELNFGTKILGYSLERIKHNSDMDREIIIFQDITEAKKKEKKINNRKQRELLGELAMYVAHEVKNSLNIIRGYSQLILETKRIDDIHNTLNIFIDETDRLNKLTHNILDYTKKTSLDLEKVDLVSFTREFLEKTFKNENINFMCSENTAEVFVDKDKIIQVYINLIQNGLDAVGKFGIFNIFLERKNASSVSVTFETDAPIEQEFDVEILFDNDYSTKEDGNGLGLTICKNIMEEHFGKIWAYRNKFGGLSVVLDFPQRFSK
jgi:hypothetical protein